MNVKFYLVCVVSTIMFWMTYAASAEVVNSNTSGFQIVINKTTELEPSDVYDALIKDLAKWWDPAHTYSGDAENLSMDLEQGCLLENLSGGGFVRHMEVVCHQPGKILRLTGGLGPLQEMGITGAMTFKLSKTDDRTQIQLVYNAAGFSGPNMDEIAPAVDRVLDEQLERLKKFCDKAASDGAK